jgi:adenylosuccinate lyase
MVEIFSDTTRYRTWRRLWIALAEAQSELGLAISEDQLQQLRDHRDKLDLEAVAEHEARLRHDVMAHLRVYAEQCPKAGGILHLGATSAYVGDNTDLVLFRDGLQLLERRLAAAIRALATFARSHVSMPTLGYTHLQPAQLTTVGKRAVLWLQDLLLDADTVSFELGRLRLRGAKGTTGTQASYLELFDGDHERVEELDRRVAAKLGFQGVYPVTGQTYPRKLDAALMAALGGIAVSASKFATDLRLLMGLGQMEEPIAKSQVGSSAMPWKRNPVKTERIVSLARLVIGAYDVAAANAATQWLERSLDDSANRRMLLPRTFMTTDALLVLLRDVARGLVVHERVVERAVREEAPYLATEAILMAATRAGGDRQHLHEKLRQHAFEVRDRERGEGADNDLLQRIAADADFGLGLEQLKQLSDPSRFVGRAPEQATRFLDQHVEPYLARFPESADAAETPSV